ncbi:hypothetical protein D3C87_1133310 [compost metagenome]
MSHQQHSLPAVLVFVLRLKLRGVRAAVGAERNFHRIYLTVHRLAPHGGTKCCAHDLLLCAVIFDVGEGEVKRVACYEDQRGKRPESYLLFHEVSTWDDTRTVSQEFLARRQLTNDEMHLATMDTACASMV